MTKDKLKFIRRDLITCEDRARQDLGNIEELTASIQAQGVLQPITVRPSEDGMFKLLAGGRRYVASGMAGLSDIPCLIRDTDDEVDDFEIELIENIHRKDFAWHERDALLLRIHNHCKEHNLDWSARKTAALLGRSIGSVSMDLQMANTLQSIPELKECETKFEAVKMLKKLQEKVINTELRNRQAQSMQNNSDEAQFLHRCDANYRIMDTLEGLKDLRDRGMFSFIEVDPPYGIDLDTQKAGASDYTEVPRDEYVEFISAIAKELFRVSHHHTWMVWWFGPTWFCETKAALQAAGWKVRDIPGIWVKSTGQTLQPQHNLANAYEPFFICSKGQPAITKVGRTNVFTQAPTPPNKKYHPTERPVELILDILQTFAHPADTVLVPFLGSGATLRACYLNGMVGMGWDIDDKYKDRFMLACQEDLQKLNQE